MATGYRVVAVAPANQDGVGPLPSALRRRANRDRESAEKKESKRDSTYYRDDINSGGTSRHSNVAPSFSAPILRNLVTNLPPLQSPCWKAPGGQREPNSHPSRVCSDDLQEAAIRGDLGLVRRLVQAGASVNAPIRALGEDEFMTLPHMLASKPEIPNSTRILAEIVESMANPNVRSSMGSTPLMLACLKKNVGAVEVLLGCGTATDPINDQGHTALRCGMILEPTRPAGEELSAEIARLLADSNANLDEGGGVPPITEAVLQNNGKGVAALLELGATPNGIHEAVTHAPVELIQMLVDREANPFVRDGEGKTVMEAALARGNDDITTMLRDYIGNLERSQHPHLALRRLDEEDSHDGRAKGRHKRGPRDSVDSDDKDSLGEWAKRRARIQQYVRHIYKGLRFQIMMFAVLLLALFLPDLWVITSATNTEALDSILLFILSCFTLEFCLQLIGEWSSYFLSFAFWMDIVGILSVPLDHSYVTNLVMNNIDLDGATLARATKIVKLSVRSIRFSRLVKLIRFLPDSGQAAVGSTAKKMAAILGKKVSIQVSCLIIVTVIILPTLDFFMFPVDDYSMLAWTTLIHRAYSSHSSDLAPVVADFEEFYKQLSFFPYEVHCTETNGTGRVIAISGRVPHRVQDRIKVEIESPDGHTSSRVYFNFQDPHRTESICNCLLITAIILIMFTSASLVTHSVSKIVLMPLERLLSVVQSIAGQIFSSVKKMCGNRMKKEGEDENEDEGSNEGDDVGFGDETKLIGKVLKKLAALSEITARRMPIDDFEQLDEDHRGMLQDFAVPQTRAQETAKQGEKPASVVMGAEHAEFAWGQLENEGVRREALDRWDFHVADIYEQQRLTLCVCLLLMCGGPMMHGTTGGRSSLGIESVARCRTFVDTVAVNYGSPDTVKYHNFMHACDVAFTMFRCLTVVKAEHFIGIHERFAMIVSAMAHDMGHPGYNNAFLIETSHELAVRYNDASPLENMHSARLFQILSNPTTNVFVNLALQHYREVRQVCIECILSTDNTRHYTLLSELQVTYEDQADLFDSVADVYENKPEDFPPSEVIDFYCTPDVRKLIRSFFLHFVDISNAMKPWRQCKFWAELIFEEFFRQGDSEKAMGIPVQPLNDREKVNKPQVQLGFTEFFVAPLASAVARWMPPLRVCEDNVHENLDRWTRKWLDTDPSHDDQDRLAHRLSRLRSGDRGQQSRVQSQFMTMRRPSGQRP